MEYNTNFIIIISVALLVPVLASIVITYVILNSLAKANEQKANRLLRLKAFSRYVPLRIAAHERLILYLERIQPEILLLRCSPSEFDADRLKLLMLHEVQSEFEHNIVQQLYINQDSWNLIVKAKIEVMELIHTAVKKVGSDASGIKLAKQISIEVNDKDERLLIERAILALKYDVNSYFN